LPFIISYRGSRKLSAKTIPVNSNNWFIVSAINAQSAYLVHEDKPQARAEIKFRRGTTLLLREARYESNGLFAVWRLRQITN